MPKFPDEIYSGGVKVNTSAEAATLVNVAPVPTSAALDGTKKIVTITFPKPIFQYAVTAAALKALVTVATNGTTFGALGASDTVTIPFPRTLVVTFNAALTTATNKIKVGANAICSGNGTVNAEYTTAALDAS